MRGRFILFALFFGMAIVARAENKEIPNAYSQARSDARYGTFNSVFGSTARPYQKRLLDLENQAYGLSHLSLQDAVKQSELAYYLENEVMRLNLDIGNEENPMSDFERGALLFGTAHVYQTIRQNSERLYEDMIRFIDAKLPGPTGRQIRSETLDGASSLYEPNYRSDTDMNPAERYEHYREMLKKFLDQGGSLFEMKTLDTNLARQFQAVTNLEYVWLESGQVRVTEGKAGHVLLAQGQLVKSAGQLILVRNNRGDFTLAVISNSSGNYKPDLFSAQQMAQKVQKEFGVPAELVLVTKGEPLSTQAIKIYLKGRGENPEKILRDVKAVADQGEQLLHLLPSVAASAFAACGCAFSSK